MRTDSGLQSFFLGGFECSTHRLRQGKRLDLIAATQHDRYCEADYARLRDLGLTSARDGIRWHLIETSPYQYDFRSLIPMIRAARNAGIQIIWDLFHYGWPDDLDIFSCEFLHRFGRFAREVARVLSDQSDEVPYFCPVNEISFFAWAAGDFGILNPFASGRGQELKVQLVRATMTAMDNIRTVSPHARFVQVDPVINVVPPSETSAAELITAAAHTGAQFEAWDMLSGRIRPELGGSPEYLDIIGANYYIHNQWVHQGTFIEASDPRYKPLHQMLVEAHARYCRPLLIAETGIEGQRRPEWLRYICGEIARAIQCGVPVEGICLYPILNYPGWDDERDCHAGLWDACKGSDYRGIYGPLAEELERQRLSLERTVPSAAFASV